MLKVYAIILNYNSYEDSIAYSNNLLNQKGVDLRILIVDNNSPNESFKILSQEFQNHEKIEVIKSIKNGGYAYGNNFGLKHISERPYDYVLITNNDIEINNENLISDLIKSYQTCNNIGFIAPMMNENGIPSSIPAWKIPTFKNDLIGSSLILKKIFKPNYLYSQKYLSKDLQKVDCLPGSFFLGQKGVFESIEYFDENTFLYCEERILATKLRTNSLSNYLDQNLSYNHFTSNTISNTFSNIKMRKILTKSRAYYNTKYRSASSLSGIILWLAFYFSIIEHFLLSPFRFLKNAKD